MASLKAFRNTESTFSGAIIEPPTDSTVRFILLLPLERITQFAHYERLFLDKFREKRVLYNGGII